MRKSQTDFCIIEKEILSESFVRLNLQAKDLSAFDCSQIKAGQFVQIAIKESRQSWLRLPISIHNVDTEKNILSLLIQVVGEGSLYLSTLEKGDVINLVLPLGNGFSLPGNSSAKNFRALLVGGGCGIAPLFYLAKCLHDLGSTVDILIGGRTHKQIICENDFKGLANFHICTEDGSLGHKGLVITHPIIKENKYDFIYTCGPEPMMHAIAKIAKELNVSCEVSLENMMACGIGACLCCVTPSAEGKNLCVCTEGPVFLSTKLKMQS